MNIAFHVPEWLLWAAGIGGVAVLLLFASIKIVCYLALRGSPPNW